MAEQRSDCEGPLIWYACEAGGAVLHCAACGHLTVSGNFNDAAHAQTPVLTEGLAA